MTESLTINGKEYLSISATKYYMRCTERDMDHYIAQGKLRPILIFGKKTPYRVRISYADAEYEPLTRMVLKSMLFL